MKMYFFIYKPMINPLINRCETLLPTILNIISVLKVRTVPFNFCIVIVDRDELTFGKT